MNNGFSPAAHPTDSRYQDIENSQAKDHLIAILLSIFLGPLGVDRFYLGYIASGIIKLLVSCSWFILGGIGLVAVAIIDDVSIQANDAVVVLLIVLFIVAVLAMILITVIWTITDMIRISTKSLQPKNGGYKN